MESTTVTSTLSDLRTANCDLPYTKYENAAIKTGIAETTFEEDLFPQINGILSKTQNQDIKNLCNLLMEFLRDSELDQTLKEELTKSILNLIDRTDINFAHWYKYLLNSGFPDGDSVITKELDHIKLWVDLFNTASEKQISDASNSLLDDFITSHHWNQTNSFVKVLSVEESRSSFNLAPISKPQRRSESVELSNSAMRCSEALSVLLNPLVIRSRIANEKESEPLLTERLESKALSGSEQIETDGIQVTQNELVIRLAQQIEKCENLAELMSVGESFYLTTGQLSEGLMSLCDALFYSKLRLYNKDTHAASEVVSQCGTKYQNNKMLNLLCMFLEGDGPKVELSKKLESNELHIDEENPFWNLHLLSLTESPLFHKCLRLETRVKLACEAIALHKVKDAENLVLKSELNRAAEVKGETGKTFLFSCCEMGHCSIVKSMSAAGVQLSSHSHQDRSALNVALESKNGELISWVVMEGGYSSEEIVSAKDFEGKPLLYVAIELGLEEVVKKLISEYRLNWEDRSFQQSTALIIAARYDQTRLVQFFLNECVEERDVFGTDLFGKSALCYAIEGRCHQIIKAITEHNPLCLSVPVSSAVDEEMPLHFAISCKDLKSFSAILKLAKAKKELLDQVGKCKLTPLHLAVKTDKPEMVEKLIVSGADLNKAVDNLSPIQMSMKLGRFECFNVFLAQGNVSEETFKLSLGKNNPILLAIQGESQSLIERVEKMCFKGKPEKMHADCYELLSHYIKYRSFDNFRLMFECAAFVAAVNFVPESNWKLPLLHCAIDEKKIEHFNVMLQVKGVKLNLKTVPHGNSKIAFTPLMFAAKDGKLEFVKMLVEKGADITLKSKVGSGCNEKYKKGDSYTAENLASKAASIHKENASSNSKKCDAVVKFLKEAKEKAERVS
ncbi:hypothetical protein SOPP22_08505 [Shewanella sp. OPT22]|nr:hypothetical protein SOPP22_08505 [Shewanella sp. OPT22]